MVDAVSWPFRSPQTLREQRHAVPSRQTTPLELLPMDLQQEAPRAGSELAGYRLLYGLDQLPSRMVQGVLPLAGHRIHVQVHQPQGTARGTVWVIHGYLEHSALYQPLIAELLAQDYAVLLFDLPGHGLSDGTEASIAEFAVYQAILQGVAAWARQQSAAALPQPWLGMGQSTGGAIWLDHVLHASSVRRAPLVQRLFLLSPLVRPARSAWWHNPVGLSLIRKIRRSVPRAFRRNNHNPEFLRFVRQVDPLQSRVMDMAWILALSRWMPYMEAMPACRVPVWVAQGARDQTVDWRYNLEFIRRKCRLQTLLLLEEGSHQLINERADIRHALTALIPAFLQAH